MKVRSSGLNFDAEAASPFLRWLHNPWPSLFFNMISPLFLLFYWHFWAQTKVISFSKVSIALYKDLKPRHDICKKMDPRPWILPSTAIFWLQKRNFAGPFNINFDDIFLLNMGWIGSLLLIFWESFHRVSANRPKYPLFEQLNAFNQRNICMIFHNLINISRHT